MIEASLGDERRCPHCGHEKSVGCGQADGLQRFRCKQCGRSFNALTGTPLARLRKKEHWLDFGQSLGEGDAVVTSAERCGVAVSTAFRRRHRFLTAKEPSPTLTGIVEADETFVLLSYKGSRVWERAKKGLPLVTACLVGVYDLKKVGSQAWAAGDKVYWDDTAKETTKTATANTLIGVAVDAVGSGADETTGRVRLDGCSFTTAAVQPAIGDADATNTGIPVNTADTTAVATVTELDAVAGTVNGILATLRAAGIIAAA